MKGNLIKAGVAIATAVVIIAVVAMLVTGYMSAFKPKNNTTSPAGGYSTGGGIRSGGGGGISATAITPTPPPGIMPGKGELPSYTMPSQAMPQQQMPAAPMELPASQAMQSPTQPNLYTLNVVPPQQAEAPGPQFSGASPLFGSRGTSWFNIAPSPSAVPAPTPQSVKAPQRPEPAASGLTPYEYGWRQVVQRLLEIVPLLFPGYYPGLQWFAYSPA